MADPFDGSWGDSDVNVTPTNLDGTTHGSGTTAERTAITSWPANRPFFDTDLGQIFYNSHVSAPSSVTWTGTKGLEPLKRKWVHGFHMETSSSLTSGNTFYISPFGKEGAFTPPSVRTNVERLLSSDAFTVKRVRAYQTVGNLVTSLIMRRDATAEVTLNLSSANPADSGAITKPYNGTEYMSFSFGSVTGPSAYGFDIWLEIEWDDLYQ